MAHVSHQSGQKRYFGMWVMTYLTEALQRRIFCISHSHSLQFPWCHLRHPTILVCHTIVNTASQIIPWPSASEVGVNILVFIRPSTAKLSDKASLLFLCGGHVCTTHCNKLVSLGVWRRAISSQLHPVLQNFGWIHKTDNCGKVECAWLCDAT